MAAPAPGRVLVGIARAVAWIGAFVVFWSLNVQWGDDPDAGTGPPLQFKRQVNGALLIALIAAGALSASFFRGGPPGRVGRGIAVAGALAVLLIAWLIRRDALVDFPHLLQGPGWRWLLGGGGLILAAASLALAAPAVGAGKKPTRRTPARRRG